MGNSEMMNRALRARESGQVQQPNRLPSDDSIAARLNRNVLEPLTRREEDDGVAKNFAKNATLFAVGLPLMAKSVATAPFVGAYRAIRGDFKGARDATLTPLVEGAKSAAKATATSLGLFGKEAAAKYWKEDPLFAALDATGVASLAAGATRSSIRAGVVRSAAETALTKTVELGIDAGVSSNILRSKGVKTAISALDKGASTELVKEAVSSNLIKSGVLAENATKIADAFASTIASGLKQKSGSMAALNAIEHPLATAAEVAGKAKTAVLGSASPAAVTTLYGENVVSQAPERFLAIERWLEAQVAERGLKNTRENRLRIHNEWVTENPDYAVLDPMARLDHFDNYIKADTISRNLSVAERDRVLAEHIRSEVLDGSLDTMKRVDDLFLAVNDADVVRIYKEMLSDPESGLRPSSVIKRYLDEKKPTGTEVVPVRVLDKDTTDAMSETVDGLRHNIQRGVITEAKLFATLEQHFPKEMRMFKEELSAFVGGETGEKALDLLQKGINRLSSRVHARDFGQSDASVRALAERLVDETGYRAGTPPRGRFPSRASDPLTDAQSSIRLTDLEGRVGLAGRFLSGAGAGKKSLITRLGLSSLPTPVGIERAAWNENFMRGLRDLKKKHGATVRITYGDEAVVVPTTRLLQWLEANFENIAIKAEGRSAALKLAPARFLHELLEPKLLNTIGVKGQLADDIAALSKKSLADIPVEYTGIAEKFINYLRTRNPAYSNFVASWMSSVFDKSLRAAYGVRYNSRLALAYSTAQFVESRLWQTMFGGGVARNVEAIPRYGPNFLKRLTGTESLIGRNLTAPGEKDMFRVHNLMKSDVVPEISPNSPEVMLTKYDKSTDMGIKQSAKFARSTASENFWYNATGNSYLKEMTGFARNYVDRFGMTLAEVLETVETPSGNLRFKNPALVDDLRDTLTNVFAYRQGFLTSPLAKTLNSVFYPFRFNAKTVKMTAEWMNSLPPVTRAMVIRSWSEFSRWAGTDEGKKWRKKNADVFYAILNYTLPYQSLSKSIDAVSEGKLFDGRTGLIGGLPFGWLHNVAQNLDIVDESEEASSVTGKPYSRTTPKKIVSLATFNTAVKELLGVMAPSFPIYELSRGKLSGLAKFAPRNFTNELADYLTAGISLGLKELEGSDSTLLKERQSIQRGFKPSR